MDILKVGKIVSDARDRLHKEAGCSVAQTYSLRVPGSAHEVHVIMFSDSPDACSQALQATPIPPHDQPWRNAGASLLATREHILQAMKDLHANAKDTVWLTEHETVFERLSTIYGYSGGDISVLVRLWPEYYA